MGFLQRSAVLLGKKTCEVVFFDQTFFMAGETVSGELEAQNKPKHSKRL